MAVACSSCTTRNPVTGRPEVVLMSEADEQRIDERQAMLVEQQYGVVGNEELATYVDAIGQTLALHSPRQNVDYHFNIIDMDDPNAFALPGGHIYLSRGLLLLANSEAEIASVIGHEIGHVAARHAAQRDAHMKTLGISTLLGTLASGSNAGAGRSGRIGFGSVAGYSRDQEREADTIGQELVIRAGIDPMGMSTFLRSLENSTRLAVGFSIPTSYFATHPATPERILESSTTAQLREWQPGFAIAGTPEAYLELLDGLAIGKPAAEGVLEGERFLHPDLGIAVHFGKGWEIANQRSQVVAFSPGGDAVMALELDGPGTDAERAAREFIRREKIRVIDTASTLIGDLDAFRARVILPSGAGPADAEVTWIAHDGHIYRLTAGSISGGFRRYQGIFRSFSRSFRPLRQEERERLTDLRLRVVEGLEGETLGELSERVANEWSLNRVAVYNRTSIHSTLAAGQRVKVAIREAYVAESQAGDGIPGEPASDDDEPSPLESGEASPERSDSNMTLPFARLHPG